MGIKNTAKAMREDPAEPLAALLEGMATGSASSFISRGAESPREIREASGM